MEFCPQICLLGVTRLHNLKKNSQHLYPSVGSLYVLNLVAFGGYTTKLYAQFPSTGAISHKFSIAPGGETTDRIRKKLGGAKMGQTSITQGIARPASTALP